MTQPQMTTETTPSTEDFAALLDESFRQSDRIEGSVITGTVFSGKSVRCTSSVSRRKQ